VPVIFYARRLSVKRKMASGESPGRCCRDFLSGDGRRRRRSRFDRALRGLLSRHCARHTRCHVKRDGQDVSTGQRRRDLMQKISNAIPRFGALSFAALVACAASAHGQTPGNTDRAYSDSGAHAASRTRTTATKDARPGTPAAILRAARTIHISPNRHINADYLEYKLDKLPEFGQWQLAIVKNRERADLVLEIKKTALNYIFSIVEPESSIIVATGKVVAINGRVAAEDISHQIVKRMRAIRALPAIE
jgi:hypothetical protein